MIFFLILLLPCLEIVFTLGIIHDYGFANAFFAWLISFVLGIGLFRTAGMRLTVGVAKAMSEGKSPGIAPIESALIGIAGLLFLLPGFLSDVFAVLLLLPPLRAWVAKRLLNAVVVRTGMSTGTPGRTSRPASSRDDEFDASHAVIDVEAVVLEDKKIPDRN